MNYNRNTVLIAMSGGVDSSVAAYLLKQQGYNLIGVTMKTWGFSDIPEKSSGCCSLETIYNARNVASQLGFNHYTIDFTEIFDRIVINNFIDEYIHGRTPNPCVLCNKTIKWGALLEKAESLGADYIATGHYAKINFNRTTKRYYISASANNDKDQSYALWNISQHALSKTLLPIGDYSKTQIRDIASELGLKSADSPESQEICFVPNNNYRDLLEIRLPNYVKNQKGGDIIYKGKIIGKHSGYTNYTIGQRRGLNIALGKPVYVSRIEPAKNIVYVDDEDGILNTVFICRQINLQKYEELTKPKEAEVKIRYKDTASPAIIELIDSQTIQIRFKTPKKAITPGQSAVFYEGKDIIGGGVIDEVIK